MPNGYTDLFWKNCPVSVFVKGYEVLFGGDPDKDGVSGQHFMVMFAQHHHCQHCDGDVDGPLLRASGGKSLYDSALWRDFRQCSCYQHWLHLSRKMPAPHIPDEP